MSRKILLDEDFTHVTDFETIEYARGLGDKREVYRVIIQFRTDSQEKDRIGSGYHGFEFSLDEGESNLAMSTTIDGELTNILVTCSVVVPEEEECNEEPPPADELSSDDLAYLAREEIKLAIQDADESIEIDKCVKKYSEELAPLLSKKRRLYPDDIVLVELINAAHKRIK
jgi:hypothetical protein